MTSGLRHFSSDGGRQRIRYTDSTVYVTANDLAGYTMGPWFSADMTSGVF